MTDGGSGIPPAGGVGGILPPAGDGGQLLIAHDGEQQVPVPLPIARFDDPHLGDAARHPKRVEAIVAVFLLIGIAGVAAFGGAYVQNASSQWLAITLGVGLFGMGFGLTAWGKYLMPRGPFEEARHELRNSDSDRQAIAAALVERTGVVVKRRRLLGGLVGTGFGIFGIVAIFPLLRSLGPQPHKILFVTDWRKGSLLVDNTGRPVHKSDLQPGGLVTVFPKGFQNTDSGRAVDQTVLIRLQASGNIVTMRGRDNWAPDGYVAYSKVCTHLGCPVGLYEEALELLVCPCHQSMFKVRDGAVPTFGPAPRALPQLPLMIDPDGYLRARAGYNQPVGPGFWERTTPAWQNTQPR